jgi:hypothetical protein
LAVWGEAIAAEPQTQKPVKGLEKAQGLLKDNGIDIEGQYRITKFIPYSNGGGMVEVIPLFKGLPIFHYANAFHFKRHGKILRDRKGNVFIGGKKAPAYADSFDIRPRIGADQAKASFSQEAEWIDIPSMTGRPPWSRTKGPECARHPEDLDAELGIYKGTLAWRVSCSGQKHPFGFVSAGSGAVIYFDSGIRS